MSIPVSQGTNMADENYSVAVDLVSKGMPVVIHAPPVVSSATKGGVSKDIAGSMIAGLFVGALTRGKVTKVGPTKSLPREKTTYIPTTATPKAATKPQAQPKAEVAPKVEPINMNPNRYVKKISPQTELVPFADPNKVLSAQNKLIAEGLMKKKISNPVFVNAQQLRPKTDIGEIKASDTIAERFAKDPTLSKTKALKSQSRNTPNTGD